MVNQEKERIKQEKSTSYDRKKFEDKKSMEQYKKDCFAGKRTTRDEYTGKRVHSSKQSCENKYHGKANDHLANTDHIKPLKEGYEQTKFNYFVSDDDVRCALNNSINFAITNGKLNQSKREKSNSEYIKNNNCIDAETKERMLEQEKKANRNFDREIRRATSKNAFKIAQEGAGNRAKSSAKIATVSNVCQIIEGEKELDEAVTDVICTSLKSSVEGACSDVTEVFLTGKREQILSTFENNDKVKDKISKIFKDENMGLVVSVVFNATALTYKVLNGEISVDEFRDRLIDDSVNIAIFYQLATIAAPYGFVAGCVINFIASKVMSAIDQWLEENCQRQIRIANYKRLEEMYRKEGERIKRILEDARKQYEIDTTYALKDIADSLENKDMCLFEKAIRTLCKSYEMDVAIESDDEMKKLLMSENGCLNLGDCVQVSY